MLLISPPQLLFDLRRQRVKQVLLHHQAAPLQEPTLAELHREALQAVSSQLQLRQTGELSKSRGQRLQAIVSQIQSPQFLALEQLWGQSLNPVCCDSEVLQVLEKTHISVDAGEIIVAQV